MAYVPFASVTYTATAGLKVYSIPFPVLAQSHVHLYLNGTESFDFTIDAGSTTLTIGSGTTITNGEQVKIRRQTPQTNAGQLVDWVSGGAITEGSLDLQRLQALYLSQEDRDRAEEVQAALDSLLVGSGNLPAVTTGDNNAVLAVVAGAWAKTIPLDARAALGLTDRAIEPIVDRYVTIVIVATVQNIVSGTWFQSAGSKVTPQLLVPYKDTDGSISIVGNDVNLALPGTYLVRLSIFAANQSTSFDAVFATRVTNELDSASQTTYLQPGAVKLGRATSADEPSTGYSGEFLLTTTVANQKIAVRANNSAAFGNVQILNPSRLYIERLRN